jgi:glycosyltransferase involved in cell wall biosynthesis
MKGQRIGIVIPAYNEAEVLGSVLKDLKMTLKGSKIEAEIVVINDRSTDKTEEIASRSKVTVVSHILNQGAGGATSTGLCYARDRNFDITVTMDADGQHSVDDVVAGIKKMQGGKADLLIGSRLLNPEGMSRTKIIGNRGLSVITAMLFGVYVTDSQSGLRIFSKNALQKLEWKSTGYEFCSEMIWRARQAKLKIAEYPIKAVYTDYSRGKGQNNWNGINIVKSLIKQRFEEIIEW